MRLLCNDLVNIYIFTLVKIYGILVNASIIITLGHPSDCGYVINLTFATTIIRVENSINLYK
jgi:hypothetical protein